MPADDRDKMLREMAQHRGFRLVKSRRRKPGGDFGRYGLKDAKGGKPCFGFGKAGLEADAGAIEAFLRGSARADWKSSLAAPSEPRRRAAAKPAATRTSRSAAPSRRAAPKRAPPPEPKAPPAPPPRPELTIREAASRDAAAIRALIEGDDAPDKRRIAKLISELAKAGRPVLVADQDGIVGCVSYDVIRVVHHDAPIGRIGFLVTARSERRRGIGSALLKAAEVRLRKLRCGSVELVNRIELSNANGFLRHHGFERSGYRFARESDG